MEFDVITGQPASEKIKTIRDWLSSKQPLEKSGLFEFLPTEVPEEDLPEDDAKTLRSETGSASIGLFIYAL